MSCGCNSSGWGSAPNYGNWGGGTSAALLPVIYDPNTGQIRPLGFGEAFPQIAGGPQCGCGPIYGTLEPTKALQDAYADLQRRLKNLEMKFCECVCGPQVTPPPVPTPVEVIDTNTFVNAVTFDVATRNLVVRRNDGQSFTVNIPDNVGETGEFIQEPVHWRSDVVQPNH